MPDPRIVPVTNAHVEALGVHIPMSFKGVAVIEGNCVLGIAGYYPDHGRMVMSAYIADSGRFYMDHHQHLKVLIKAGRQIVALARMWGVPIDCEADTNVPRSCNLLKHLGFERNVKSIFTWRH